MRKQTSKQPTVAVLLQHYTVMSARLFKIDDKAEKSLLLE
jgi:hypothetical protein